MSVSRRSILKLAGLTHFAKIAAIKVAHAEDMVYSHVSSFFGPAKYPKGFTHFDYVNPDAPKGGVMRLPAYGSFDSFNPYIVRGEVAAGIAGLTMLTLTTQSADEVAVEYGLIAEGMYHPADYSYAAFMLRENATWHDGAPISVDDVIYGFEVQKKHDPRYQFYYKNVTKAEKAGPREVVFRFDVTGNRELPQIIGQMMPVPKHYWEGQNAKGQARDIGSTTLEPPLGCGAYKLKDFSTGQFTKFERLPGHWTETLGVTKGTNNFGEYHYLYFLDRQIAFEAFKGDQVDVRLGPGTVEWVTQYDIPAVKKGLIVKDTFYTKDAQRMQAFVLNLRRAKFADGRVRQALNFAYDFEGQMKVLSHGNFNKRLQSFFANSELASSGLPQGKELEILEPFRGQIPDDVFTTEFKNPVNGDPQNNRRNLRKALDLLQEAGWELRGNNLVNKSSGERFEVEFLLDDPGFEEVALFYKSNLEKLGIAVTIRTVDSSQYQNRVINFDFDIITDVWAQSLSPGNEQREYWGSAAAERPGSQNTAGIKSPAIDQIIEKIIFAATRDDQIAATRALDRVLLWSQFVVSQFYRAEIWLPHWDRFGKPEKNPDHDVGFPSLWWWDDEKAQKVASQK